MTGVQTCALPIYDDLFPGGFTLVDEFKSPSQTILNCSSLQETVLVVIDKLKDHFLKPVSQNLSDEFKTAVKQGDWPVISDSSGGGHFRDQSNKSSVNTIKIKVSSMEFITKIINIMFNNVPTGLKKLPIKTIWAWSFIIRHAFNHRSISL